MNDIYLVFFMMHNNYIFLERLCGDGMPQSVDIIYYLYIERYSGDGTPQKLGINYYLYLELEKEGDGIDKKDKK